MNPATANIIINLQNKFNINFFNKFFLFYLYLLLIIINNSNLVLSDSDFMSKCAGCHCSWYAGKKTANCDGRQFEYVPRNLSSELQVLDLSNNRIAEIRQEEFITTNLIHLNKLFIRSSTIQEIHHNGFNDLSILIELDLSNNSIRLLSPGVFRPLLKIRAILLSHNLIEQLENNLFENLTSLNKIALDNNKIHKIGLSTFTNCVLLSNIQLESNRLAVMTKDIIKSIAKLSSLTLANNPWNCTCELRQFKDYVIDMNLYTEPTSCQSPEKLKNKLWKNIPAEDFACRPSITRTSRSANIEVSDENITLTCEFKGWPQPRSSWVYKKNVINQYDTRFIVKEYPDGDNDKYVSELKIYNINTNDKGKYTCLVESTGGNDQADILLSIAGTPVIAGTQIPVANDSNFMFIIAAVAIAVVVLFIILIILCCCLCRKNRKNIKNQSTSENGLLQLKMDKSHNDSMIRGSVMPEAQKGLLSDVNPVEKPPRRTQSDTNSRNDLTDSNDMKKTLLDETVFGSHDEETQSIALSDSIPRSRQAYVEDGYGGTLPPDLIAFPTRFAQSPSLQSSMSNIPDGRYVKSPIQSPVYQNPLIYQGQMIPTGFRTLQHPKGRLVMPAARSNQAFAPAPLMYPPVLMKQGYVTIPRKPRIPSWTPSMNSGMSDYPPTSPTSTIMSGEIVEPVYDNLGLRTTAAGSSALNINKLDPNASLKFSMKNRPLPATPNNAGCNPGTAQAPPSQSTPIAAAAAAGTIQSQDAIVQSPKQSPEHQQSQIQQQQQHQQPESLDSNDTMNTSETEPLYGRSGTAVVINAAGEMATKMPPRPPPKPKKRLSVASVGGGGSGGPNSNSTTNQLFEDEGEDGTEV